MKPSGFKFALPVELLITLWKTCCSLLCLIKLKRAEVKIGSNCPTRVRGPTKWIIYDASYIKHKLYFFFPNKLLSSFSSSKKGKKRDPGNEVVEPGNEVVIAYSYHLDITAKQLWHHVLAAPVNVIQTLYRNNYTGNFLVTVTMATGTSQCVSFSLHY